MLSPMAERGFEREPGVFRARSAYGLVEVAAPPETSQLRSAQREAASLRIAPAARGNSPKFAAASLSASALSACVNETH